MEETTKTPETNKLSYDQLERVALQLQQRAMEAEAKLNSVNMTTIRLDYLFKVIDKPLQFPVEFVDKCASEIMDILEIKEEKPESAPIDIPEE